MIIKEHVGIPDFIAQFIEERYHNYRTTQVYIKEFIGMDNVFSAEMEDEKLGVKETLIYHICGTECAVLNELVLIKKYFVESFSSFIFKKYKTIKKIRFRKLYKPLTGQSIISYSNVSDFCIAIPKSKEEYDSILGKKTRIHLRQYKKKLFATTESLKVRINEKFQTSDINILYDFSRLKEIRYHQIKKTNTVTINKVEKLSHIATLYGKISVIELNDKVIGGLLCFNLGLDYYVIISTWDVTYSKLEIDKVVYYLSIQDAIDNGCTNYHLLWGFGNFKSRLGAKEIVLYDSLIFASKNIHYYIGKIAVKKEQMIISMKKNKRIQNLYKFIHK